MSHHVLRVKLAVFFLGKFPVTHGPALAFASETESIACLVGTMVELSQFDCAFVCIASSGVFRNPPRLLRLRQPLRRQLIVCSIINLRLSRLGSVHTHTQTSISTAETYGSNRQGASAENTVALTIQRDVAIKGRFFAPSRPPPRAPVGANDRPSDGET